MFTKILIANRGAIACRIIRTLRNMGISSVAVYAQADANSLHVEQADESYCLGDGRATETYLNQDRLFEIVHLCGAQAIHPGYGFLSENPDFVNRCEAEGIVFIGPTAEQMRAFGLKHSARELAQRSNVPLLPGSALLDTVEDATAAAAAIGYPIMLKSTAGGGGIGMQLCWDESELRNAYETVRRLSETNFSNSGVFLEKFIEFARHIEVQIFGDGTGKAIALGERDCSTQRRNQKVIEESPASNIPEKIRQQLYDTAVQLVSSVNYRNAGTVEYVYDQHTRQFYFLEVNTRLQVEHAVTEQLFNIDLVEWMVSLAANEFADLEDVKKSLSPKGHCIEVRIYAENPNKDFQPCAGLLSQVAFPTQPGLRIDHWIEAGLEVSPLFDPMLAKCIVHADDRPSALSQLDKVLADTELYGIETNIDYARKVLETEAFKNGGVFTRYLNDFPYHPSSVDVLSSGTMTTIQD